jgi:PKD repeat protein
MLNLNFWLYTRTTHPLGHVCSPAYDSIQISISAMPEANFAANPTSGGLPLAVQFSDSTTISRGTIQIREWYFGDGSFSSDQNPVHTYYNSGTFTVKLRIISDAGCEDSVVKTNYINTTTGIKIQNSSKQIKFYPNPAKSMIKVEYSGYEPTNLIITDILENSILQTTIIPGKNELSLTNCKPGIYFIFMDGMIAGKIIIE